MATRKECIERAGEALKTADTLQGDREILVAALQTYINELKKLKPSKDGRRIDRLERINRNG